MENKVVIILGMGRSGTSFTANWLNKCGLHVGEALLQPNYNNVKGFFEDKNILEFQQKILVKSGIKNPFKVELKSTVVIDKYDIEEAKRIIELRQLSQWGWKDPRTVLLMKNLWNKIVPHAKLVVVYRPYWDVVDSIMRADWKSQKNRDNKLIGWIKLLGYWLGLNKKKRQNEYLESWIRFNLDILETVKDKKQEDFLITNVRDILSYGEQINSKIASMFDINIKYVDPNSVFSDELFNSTAKSNLSFDSNLEAEAERILKELDSLRVKDIS